MKVSVTIGQDVDGKYHVLAGPNEDVNGQRDLIRKITNDGGEIKSGKKSIQLCEAIILHSTKGRLLPRKF